MSDNPQPQPGPSPTPSPQPTSGQKPSDYISTWIEAMEKDAGDDTYEVSDVIQNAKTLRDNIAAVGF